jgi:SAM-dependent methyltransferase
MYCAKRRSVRNSRVSCCDLEGREIDNMGKIDAYSDFWKEKVREYGLKDGLDKIIDILKELDAKDYFELGIGTGWPIASELLNAGKNIYGCDLSAQSVLNAVNDFPQLYGRVYAGTINDYERLDVHEYDCVYCIRSSWHMKDFPQRELKSMLELTKPGGYVVFNIINRESSLNKKSVRSILKGVLATIVYRLVCSLKVLFIDEDYSGQIKQYYYTDREIRDGLDGCDIRAVSVNQLEKGMDETYDVDSQKILYIVRKQ